MPSVFVRSVRVFPSCYGTLTTCNRLRETGVNSGCLQRMYQFIHWRAEPWAIATLCLAWSSEVGWGGGLFCRAPMPDTVFRRLCHAGGLLSPLSASRAGPHHLTQDSGRATGVCYDLHPGMPKMTRGFRSFDFSISGD